MIILENKTYNNKIVWIIGASSGIGEALSKELASKGAIICLSARRAQELEKLKSSLSDKEHEIFPLDVCDAEAVITTANNIHTHFGRIDSIIFLAAAYKPMRLEMLNISDVRQIIETNVLGAFYVINAVVPLLKVSLMDRLLYVAVWQDTLVFLEANLIVQQKQLSLILRKAFAQNYLAQSISKLLIQGLLKQTLPQKIISRCL